MQYMNIAADKNAILTTYGNFLKKSNFGENEK